MLANAAPTGACERGQELDRSIDRVMHRAKGCERQADEQKCRSCQSRSVSFCGVIPDRDLKQLQDSRSSACYGPRQTIICEGEPAASFFNVVSGIVKLFRIMLDGRIQIVGFRTAGEFFGLSGAEKYNVTAQAITEVELCRFSREKLKALQDLPEVRAELLKLSQCQLDAAEEQVLLLGRKTAREKVASFLQHYAGKLPGDASKGPANKVLPISRKDMADFLGLTIETVSRTLGTFVEKGLITIGRSRVIYVIDKAAIQRMAEGEPD